jgi:hypothetical protein
MLIMPPSYPFAKARHLVEELISSAKKATKKANENTASDELRPSSLDYLIITSDVEDDLASLRARTATSETGESLTGKPFVLSDGFFASFLEKAKNVLHSLPRSHTRGALVDCRRGQAAAMPAYNKLRENVQRQLGGRFDENLLTDEQFDEIFPVETGFFVKSSGKSSPGQAGLVTYLADYLELADLI